MIGGAVMNNIPIHSLTGIVQTVNNGEIILTDLKFKEDAYNFLNFKICKIKGDYQTAELKLKVGELLEIKAPFEAANLERKFVKISNLIDIKRVNPHNTYFDAGKKYNTDYSRNTLTPVPNLSMQEIMPIRHQKTVMKKLDAGYPYRKNFEKGMNIVNAVKDMDNGYAVNVLKSTRVGATTNIIMSSLVQDIKTVVFVPNNELMSAVEKAYDYYVDLTEDETKTLRKIQSNKRVCPIAHEKMEENVASSELQFLMRENCKKCSLSSSMPEKVNETGKPHPILTEGDKNTCYQKGMVDELIYFADAGKPLKYDIVVMTFDKAFALMKTEGVVSEFFADIIKNADLLLMDEFGQYLAKQGEEVVVWENRTMVDTTEKKGKLAAPTTTNVHENLKSIKTTMDEFEKLEYQILEPIFTEFFDRTKDIIEDKKAFRRIKNPLHATDYGAGRYRENMGKQLQGASIPMTEMLEEFFWNNYTKFEGYINPENKEDFKYMISLITVLLSKDVVFHYSEYTRWINNKEAACYEKFKIKTLKLSPADDVLIENINSLIQPNQKVIFSDATTPPFRFNRLKRVVLNMMFGDPLESNKQLMVIQDKSLHKWDNTRWHKGGKDTEKSKGYKSQVIEKLMNVINKNGAGNIKIWTTNKSIAKEITVLLNLKKEDMAGTPNRTPADNQVIVDWMRSSEARGVESDRRVHIVLGNPDVPLQAYAYLAFMYPDYFDMLQDKTLETIGKKHKFNIDKIRKIIGTFNTPDYIGNTAYRKEMPDEIEAEIFLLISNQLRISLVASEAWQASSRAKDPSSKNPSVIYLLGWEETAVHNMVQWGYNLHIMAGKKHATDMATLIPPPLVIQGGVEDAKDWLSGKKCNPELLLSKDFSEYQSAVGYAIAYNGKNVTSKDVWPNITPNLHVGYDSENHQNGFFVAYNRIMKSDTIKITEISPGLFDLGCGSSPGLDIPNRELVMKVLLTAYRNNKKELKVEDIEKHNRKDDKITAERIKKAFKTINKNKLLKGSTWSIEEYEVTKGKYKGKKYSKIVKNKPLSGGLV